MAEPSDGASNKADAQSAEADDGFVYRDPDTAPAALVQLAKQGGKGWVYEVDVTHVVRDQPISMKSVVGAWEVDDEGELTGWFAENDSYVPSEGVVTYVLQLFPHDIESPSGATEVHPTSLSYANPAVRLWHERWPFRLVTDEDPRNKVIAIVGLIFVLGLLVWMKLTL